MEFLDLIDRAIEVVNEEMTPERGIFKDRYLKMIKHLEILKLSYTIDTLKKDQICLDIVRMLDINDSERLKNMIYSVDHYYQNNIYIDE